MLLPVACICNRHYIKETMEFEYLQVMKTLITLIIKIL